MKKLFIIILTQYVALVMSANMMLVVNGRSAHYDIKGNRYLSQVMSDEINSEYSAKLEPEVGYEIVEVEGAAVADGNYIFPLISADKEYKIKYKKVDELILETSYISFTYMPIVELNGTFGYDYAEGTVRVTLPGTDGTGDMRAKLKWRGQSTNRDGKHKRNYKVKFLNDKGKKMDRSFFGLREDNNWILDAAQVDLSRVRNRASTDLWNDIAVKPYYFDKEQKALTGTRGDFVELFLNDTLNGIYCLTEQIDRKQLKLKKHDEDNNIFHGLLWKAQEYTVSVDMWNAPDYDNTQEEWAGYEMKYPDFDDVNPTDYSVLHDAVKFVASSSNIEFAEKIDEYFDFPVLVDYFLLMEVMAAVDNLYCNIYWLCYDCQESKKLSIAVWDLDVSMGLGWSGYKPKPDIDMFDEYGTPHLLQRLHNNTKGRYDEAFNERYKELRQQGKLSADNLLSYYTVYLNKLIESGAAGRDSKRWSGDSDIYGETMLIDKDEEYLKQWIPARLAYLDAKYGYSGVVDLKTDPGEAISVTYYNSAGVASAVPHSGINIVVSTFSDGTRQTKKVVR